MNEDIEFQEIGKKTPYRTPKGFFDQVAEKTLRKAKQREQNRRKSLMLWRTLSVAASLSAMALLGYFMYETLSPGTNLIVQEKRMEKNLVTEQKHEVPEMTTVAEVKKAAPEKNIATVDVTEKVTDVISEMSDDELLQLVTMYEADPFIGETVQ